MITPSADKQTIAVLGGRGMLGSDLVKFLSSDYVVDAIDRDNYETRRGRAYDVLINANGNSRRFWANQNIAADFEASTVSVYRSLFDFGFKKYIYISSSDVYERHESPSTTSENQQVDPRLLSSYGFHKYLSENIVAHQARDYLILRCSMMVGTHLKKGPFSDVMNGIPLFIRLDSRLQLITTHAVADVIKTLLPGSVSSEVFNVGGVGAFPFSTVSRYAGREPIVSSDAERQEYEMDVSKLAGRYALKTSEDYVKDFFSDGYGA